MKKFISLMVLTIFFLPINLAFSEEKTFGQWTVDIHIDDFSDERRVGIISMGQIKKKSLIYLGLDKNEKFRKISFFVHSFDDHVCGDKDNYKVTAEALFRIDKNEAITESYNLLDGLSGNIWTDRKNIKSIIDQMFTGEILKIRVFDDFCDGLTDYKYSLNGFTDAYNYAISQL